MPTFLLIHPLLTAELHETMDSVIHCSKLSLPDEIIKNIIGRHNSNTSNFGDAMIKPWIDADCFDYTVEYSHVRRQYKHR